jgi:hypothetical protein
MRTAMRLGFTAAWWFSMLALCRLSCAAQGVPRYELFGGYSYWRFDTATVGFSGPTSLDGGKLAAAFNIKPYLGAVAEVSGGWGSKVRAYDALAGAQALQPVGKKLFFAEFLYGKAKGRITVPNEPNGGQSSSGRSFVAAGGMDYGYRTHWSFRVVQIDYLRTNTFGVTQSNFRVSTGVVYHMGQLKLHKKTKMSAP